MISFYKLWKFFSAYSFDVVIGAVSMGVFACKVLEIPIDILWLLILAGAVWIVYTSDHLVDGFSLKKNAFLFRRKIHVKHKNLLLSLVFLFSIIVFFISYLYFSSVIFFSGLTLIFIVCLYLLLIHFLGNKKFFYFFKEMLVALIYIGGIWLIPLEKYDNIPPVTVLMIITILFIYAVSEGLIASIYDYDVDKKEKFKSFSIYFGKQNTGKFVNSLLIFSIAISLIIFTFLKATNYRAAYLIMAVLGLILFIFNIKSNGNSGNKNLYRYLGDIAFWIPGILYFFIN